jgi:hypothetical protein
MPHSKGEQQRCAPCTSITLLQRVDLLLLLLLLLLLPLLPLLLLCHLLLRQLLHASEGGGHVDLIDSALVLANKHRPQVFEAACLTYAHGQRFCSTNCSHQIRVMGAAGTWTVS